MTFDKLVGQEEVKKFLLESIRADKVSHAYLFSGADGIGRKTFATYFAYHLMCHDNINYPCGSCESCILNESGTNPDIIRVVKPDDKNLIGVDEIRDMQDFISTAPGHSRYKVIIIEQAEKLSVQAQNALLKTLEEPPHYVVIILISSNDFQLLETVRSRTVKVEFRRYNNKEIIKAFKEKYPSKDIDDEILCEYSDGIIGRAFSMADSDEYKKMSESVFCSLEHLSDGKGKSLCEFENLLAENAKNKEMFFYVLLSVLRDIMMAGRYGKTAAIQNVQIADKIYNISDKIDYHKASKCIIKVNDAWRLLQKNVNYKLATDMLAVRLQEVIYD